MEYRIGRPRRIRKLPADGPAPSRIRRMLDAGASLGDSRRAAVAASDSAPLAVRRK